MDIINNRAANEMFLSKLDSPENATKLAQDTTVFIRNKMREVSFARKILPPQFVVKEELDRSVEHDGMVKIVDKEPDSKAMVVTFRGNPTSEYVMGARFAIPFYAISSPEFQKIEEELLAYEMPITDVIEKNSVLDIQKIEDENFLTRCDDAIAIEEATSAGSKLITGSYDSDETIKRSDFKKLFDCLDGDSLESDIILMSSTNYNRLALYPATTVGSSMGTEQQINGYTYSTLFGRKLVVSNKTDLLGNNIYAFTRPEFFGKFYILQDTKFWIEKRKNVVTWAAYENIGMGIGNTRSVAKLTLS